VDDYQEEIYSKVPQANGKSLIWYYTELSDDYTIYDYSDNRPE